MFRVGFLVAVFLAGSAHAHAASLYIDPASTTLKRSDAATLSVRLDTDEAAGECINVADVVLTYDEAVQPVDVSIGNSIFNVWVERPTIDEEARTITFAGGISNGYCGRISGDPRLSNVLAEIVLRSPGLRIGSGGGNEVASLAFAPETTVYRNDGFGTPVRPDTYDATIRLLPDPGSQVRDPWRSAVDADTTPPEEFSISLERTDNAFNDRYYIVFNTTDKQTGIDHYEVMEEPIDDQFRFRWGAADAPWVDAESPYVLKDQSLNSTIRVRAIDKAGNEYVATLLPDASLRTMARDQVLLYVGLASALVLFVLLVGLAAWFIRRRLRARSLDSEHATDTLSEVHDEPDESDHAK